jgi:predicted lipoprotein with Yx(FWY)xxD motif
MTRALARLAGSFGFILLASVACSPAATTPSAAPAAPAQPPVASNPSASAPVVQSREHPQLGRILVDAAGKTLYVFDRDTPGVSNCSGNCAVTWPPVLLLSGDPRGASEVSGTLGVITREDGGRQVTLNGLPLYNYVTDSAPGDATGDGVGGVWHVIKAS